MEIDDRLGGGLADRFPDDLAVSHDDDEIRREGGEGGADFADLFWLQDGDSVGEGDRLDLGRC